MILVRISHYRKKDLKILANNELDASEPWLIFEDGWKLLLQMKGIKGSSTYDSHVEFTADELALLIATALTQVSKGGAIQALAKAIGAFIREVLDVKNQPAIFLQENLTT